MGNLTLFPKRRKAAKVARMQGARYAQQGTRGTPVAPHYGNVRSGIGPGAAGYPATQEQNPRGIPAGPTTVGLNNSKRQFTDQATLASNKSVDGKQQYNLPVADIIEVDLELSGTYSSGTGGSGNIQLTTAISWIFVNNPDGTPISIIPGYALHMLYERYSKTKIDFTDTSTAVEASQSNTALPTITVPMPYLSVPLAGAKGPEQGYQIEFTYASYGSVGAWGTNNLPTVTAATGLTGMSVTVKGRPYFGDTGGFERRIKTGNLSGLSEPGANQEGDIIAVKNVSIEDIALVNFAADADLDHIDYFSGGGAQDAQVSGADLTARWDRNIQATRPVGCWWFFSSSQIVLGAESTFDIYLSSGATTTKINYIASRLAAPGSP